jgi:hypothetical protein
MPSTQTRRNYFKPVCSLRIEFSLLTLKGQQVVNTKLKHVRPLYILKIKHVDMSGRSHLGAITIDEASLDKNVCSFLDLFCFDPASYF